MIKVGDVVEVVGVDEFHDGNVHCVLEIRQRTVVVEIASSVRACYPHKNIRLVDAVTRLAWLAKLA